jgi:hypothetical protein
MQYTVRETMRLRRTLGDQASSWCRRRSRFVLLREAKLVPVRDDEAATTPKLDFESFVEVYSEIDVLWLSSTVFISSHSGNGWNEQRESGYSIELCTKAGKVKVCMYTLSLSEEWQQAQDLTLSFLRDLMKDLPADYLSTIRLQWPPFFPPSLLMSFLSILPTSAMSGASQRTDLNPRAVYFRPKAVMVELDSSLTRQLVNTVLSHHSISHVRLDIAGFWGLGMDAADLIRSTNNFLRESSTLRHAVVPFIFHHARLFIQNAGDVPFTANPHLESLDFFVNSSQECTHFFLHGVSGNPNIQHLRLFVEAQYLDWKDLKQLLVSVLPGHGSLKTVRIVFQRNLEHDEEEGYDCPLKSFASLLVTLSDSIKQIHLLYFSVMFIDTGTKEKIVSSSFQDYWDKNMVPILALNWYQSEKSQHKARLRQERKHRKRQRLLTQLMPHLALRVFDVNRGNIYHLVTASASECEMAPTSVTLIYQLLRETDIFKTR